MPERVGLAVLLVAMVVTSWLGPSSEFTESYDEWQKEWSRPEVIGMFALSATFVVGWVAMLTLTLTLTLTLSLTLCLTRSPCSSSP